MTRVLVVAASPIARTGLERLLAAEEGVVVIGHAGSMRAAEEMVATGAPEVVLVAVERGEPTPMLDAAPDAAAHGPALVVLGGEPLDEWAPAALRAGARAVLPHTAGIETIVAAIRAAALGLLALPAELAAAVRVAAPRAAPASHLLTPREIEILSLLAEGLANKEIAARLAISRHTVKTHLTALFAKLGVSTRAEAVAEGVRQGVILL